MKITGATRLYAILGDPVAQVRSPQLYTERFAAAGLDAVLVPAHMPVDAVDTVVRGLMALRNLDGLLVTVPHKARMTAFAHRLGPTAACIGAVNALRREPDGTWTGDMFDGAGFVHGVERIGERLQGRRVVQFGAGGAGSAVACALAQAGVASIGLVERDEVRARALADALGKAFPACAVSLGRPRDFDMVVNASPVGMRPGDGLPGELGPLDAGTLVGDVVITDTPTTLVRHAQQHGCRYVTGRDMLVGQSDAIMNFFLPRPATAAVA